MGNRLQPITIDSYQPLRETVCEALRDAIRRGILEPGERLMDISRTPVREAIRKLEQEGYVIMMPRRGTYVSSVSVHDVKEIFEIRSALESLSTGLAAIRIEPEELEKLRALLAEIEGHIERKDIDKIVGQPQRSACRDNQHPQGTARPLSHAVNVLPRSPARDVGRTSRNGRGDCCRRRGRCSRRRRTPHGTRRRNSA